ncbi:MAG: EamA family transporter [Lentisphaeria bacterium]|nr:EamA family transporter [Lentisphaeria bacterium]
MSVTVFGMVFLSASLHVFWNALAKQSRDKLSFAWLTNGVGALCALPLFLFCRVWGPGALGLDVFLLAMASGLIESLYFVTLFSAYDRVDLSVAYPLSRGVAPVFSLVPGAVFLGDTLTAGQGCGVGIVVAGVFLVAWSAMRRSDSVARVRGGVLLALATGAMIALYHVVDRRALTLPSPPRTGEYFFLMHAWLALFVSAWVLGRPSTRRRAFREWHGNRGAVLLVGFLSVFAYLLIMAALRVGNVTLVAATRNSGIVISTLAGALLLREPICRLRLAGVLGIVTGVVTLLLAGD